MKKINFYLITLVVMLAVSFIAGVASVSAQTQTSFEADLGAKALVNKALKHYGHAQIVGDRVVFEKGRKIGFIVSHDDPNKALELATERALSEPELITRSRTMFRWNINPTTLCDRHKGEIFSYEYKKKHYTLLICKR